jgi:hypothetical protein
MPLARTAAALVPTPGRFTHPRLSGAAIRRVMRCHRITIREAAAIFGMPMRQVRRRRAEGVVGALLVWEWMVFLPAAHSARARDGQRGQG